MTNTVKVNELELTLVKKELFEGIEIECYEDQNGDFRITRKQIGEALDYKDKNSFNNIFKRNKIEIGNPLVVKMTTHDKNGRSVIREVETYTFRQLFQILRFSKQSLANAFMDWASLTVEQLVMNKAKLKFNNSQDAFDYKRVSNEIAMTFNNKFEEIKNENKEIKEQLKTMQNNLIFKQYENPRHRFEASITKYAIHNDYNGSQRYYYFYRDLENWLNIKLPQRKNFTTKEYILSEIGIDIMECFIDGIISGRIIKSQQGYFVDLNGIFSNPVEWNKIKKNEFDNKCAYCGKEDVLIAEHLIAQSQENSTDMIHNIVPACSCCNESKGTESVKTWYPKQESYDENRLRKIVSHWKKYKVE